MSASATDPCNPSLTSLRKSVGCLTAAYLLFAKSSASSSRPLETLRVARRSLEEALALAEARDEDEQVQVLLRQHERALAERRDAEARCADEEQQVAGLRAHVAEAERSVAKHRREQRQVHDVGRLGALEKRCVAARALVRELQVEAQAISQMLSSSNAHNEDLERRAKQFEQQHSRAVVENVHARQVLGDHPSLEAYRRSKQQELHEADETLAQAFAECEAEMARLTTRLAAEQERVRADIKDFWNDVQELQSQAADTQAQAEDILSKQAVDHRRTLEETDSQVAAEMRALDERRQERVMALRQETSLAQRCLRDAAGGARRQLELQRHEARLAYRERARCEEARCESAVLAELRTVEEAKREREQWERRAARMRENYRAHAVKSGSYVRSLDPGRKEQLMNLWMH